MNNLFAQQVPFIKVTTILESPTTLSIVTFDRTMEFEMETRWAKPELRYDELGVIFETPDIERVEYDFVPLKNTNGTYGPIKVIEKTVPGSGDIICRNCHDKLKFEGDSVNGKWLHDWNGSPSCNKFAEPLIKGSM